MTATGKPRIKKLTPEKVHHFRDEIVKRNGQELDLTGRGIESIVSLEGLQTATKLDLSHNELTKLAHLTSVPHVTMLKLTHNKLNGDGLTEIQHLKKLVILNAADNLVTRIPFEVLRNVRTLKALVLNNNSISTLDWIPKLLDLNSLIVSNNRITQIPQRVVENLPRLKKLSISYNLLEEIPNVSQWSEMTELRLSHNRITTIPAHVALLKNLKVLELSYNQIDDWSGLEALSSLGTLRQLNLIGNPICGKKLEASAECAKEEEEKKGIDEIEEDSEGGGNDSEDQRKKSSECKKADLVEAKQQLKLAKRLDAKHKQYNFKMKRLFPYLVVRDAARVLDKRVHGYVAPPKEDKTPKPSKNKGEQGVTGKRQRDCNVKKPERKALKANPFEVSSKDEKSKKNIPKMQKRDHLTASEPTMDVAVTSKPEKNVAKHLKKPAKTSELTRGDGVQAASSVKSDAKDKETVKEKKEKKVRRQRKDIATGVVAVKQFKKAKKVDCAGSTSVDFTQINFMPDVGFGGSSAWD